MYKRSVELGHVIGCVQPQLQRAAGTKHIQIYGAWRIDASIIPVWKAGNLSADPIFAIAFAAFTELHTSRALPRVTARRARAARLHAHQPSRKCFPRELVHKLYDDSIDHAITTI